MKYYVCYENEEGCFADGYIDEKTALEYSNEAIVEGYKNVIIRNEYEIRELGYVDIWVNKLSKKGKW